MIVRVMEAQKGNVRSHKFIERATREKYQVCIVVAEDELRYRG